MKAFLKKILLAFFSFCICLLCRTDDDDSGGDDFDGGDDIDTGDDSLDSLDISDEVSENLYDDSAELVDDTETNLFGENDSSSGDSIFDATESSPSSGVVLTAEQADSIDWSSTSNTEEEIAILHDMEEKGELDMTAYTVDETLADPEKSTDHLPTERTGTFAGERGNSEFTPNNEAALAKMAEYGIESIPYENGEANFTAVATHDSPWGKLDTTVEIGHMTVNRENPSWEYGRRPAGTSHDANYDLGNFAQADNALLERIQATHPDATVEDVVAFREERGLTWHETKDGTTMQLVPTEIHDACRHSGGVSQMSYSSAWGDVRRNN